MLWTNEPHVPYPLLALTPHEVKILTSVLEKARKKIQKDYDKYLDIHESGDATERQQTRLFDLEDALNVIDIFIKNSKG